MPRPPKDNPNWSEPDHPVVNASWGRAREDRPHVGGRLPTEAQWEYAARGGIDDQNYPWGPSITAEQANYDEKLKGSSPAVTFPPNGFNLCDMIGNVWGSGSPIGTRRGSMARARRSLRRPDCELDRNQTDKRVVRLGGSWRLIAIEVRTSNRGFQTPKPTSSDDFGFRCLIDEIPPDAGPPAIPAQPAIAA